jgi:hypothetical protein
MSNESKNRARFAHSLWNNVHAYDNSICGAIFHYGDFKLSPVVTKSFDFIIPYDDILPLQAFGYFPNALCGQLELEAYFDQQGFVYCQINPDAISKSHFLTDNILTQEILGDLPEVSRYTHEFSQVDTPARLVQTITGAGPYTTTTAKTVLSLLHTRITNLDTIQCGFELVE